MDSAGQQAAQTIPLEKRRWGSGGAQPRYVLRDAAAGGGVGADDREQRPRERARGEDSVRRWFRRRRESVHRLRRSSHFRQRAVSMASRRAIRRQGRSRWPGRKIHDLGRRSRNGIHVAQSIGDGAARKYFSREEVVQATKR